MNMNIYLCRHGQTEYNTIGADLIGQPSDAPLTKEGVYQATLLGQRLADITSKPDFIAASSYKRAVDTAIEASKAACYHIQNIPINVFDALREYDAGSWKGLKRSEVLGNFENLLKIGNLQMDFVFPGGESYKQVSRRMSEWLESKVIYNEKLLSLSETQEVNVFVFSHSMAIKCLLHSIVHFDASFLRNILIENASITHLVWNDRGWHLHSLNDTGHL